MQEQTIAKFFQRKNNTLIFITNDNKRINLKFPYSGVKVNLNKDENYMLENINGQITIHKWTE